jgi:hypothetical protein
VPSGRQSAWRLASACVRGSSSRPCSATGLPPLHRLSGWITLLQWTWDRAENEVSLSQAALRAGREPAACYRLVRRITGMSWTNVRTAGPDWVVARFLEECHRAGSQPRRGTEGVCDYLIPPKIPPVSVRHRADSFRFVPGGQGEMPVFPPSSVKGQLESLTFNP